MENQSQARPEKAQLILNAARKQFARHGYNKATMDDVAEELGIVKGSIYYYFPTKESLFKAVLTDEMKVFIRELEAIPITDRTSSDLIRLYVEKRQFYFHQVVNLAQLDYSAWVKIKPAFHDIFRECEKVEIDFLESIFLRGRRSGEFLNTREENGAILFLHLLQGLRMRVLRESAGTVLGPEMQTQLTKEVKAFVEIFLCGMKHDTTRDRS